MESIDKLKEKLKKELANEKQKSQKEELEKEENKEIKEKKKFLNVDIVSKLSLATNKPRHIISNILDMFNMGNTIPFIARYRKDKTNNTTDFELREIERTYNSIKSLIDRKEEVLNAIFNKDKLTDEIIKKVENVNTLAEVEDIYRPFKEKKKTRATEAKRKGLEGLYKILVQKDLTYTKLIDSSKEYINDEVKTIDDAINGAKDIFAEEISDNENIRKNIKKIYFKYAIIRSKKHIKKEKNSKKIEKLEKLEKNFKSKLDVYTMYEDYEEKISSIPSHRYLAISRGEKEEYLDMAIEVDLEKIIKEISNIYLKNLNNIDEKLNKIYMEIFEDSYKRLIKTSVESEIRNELKQRSDEVAIKIFSKNLEQLLLTPPIKDKNILGFDPGFRNGSKIAIIDNTSKFLDSTIIYPEMSKEKEEEAIKKLEELIEKYKIDIIALGNGTASRESEELIKKLKNNSNTKYVKNISYVIVSEAGASIYSASKIALEEFPDVNVSIRGAISIARRLQDPLSELVKIDPKSIGVGQYQYDVNQKLLAKELENVVEDCVNKVGVDINTSTYSLLSYVSGLSLSVSKNIVKYRNEFGKIRSREEIKKIKGIGENTYKQCAGFLRVYDGVNPLEITGIHPESYNIATKVLKELKIELRDILERKEILEEEISKILKDDKKIDEIYSNVFSKEEKEELGKIYLIDILKELEKPGRDFRLELDGPILRDDVKSFNDIKVGMKLKGTVRNITAFGAFVDIGLHDDALLHISQVSNKYVKDILSVLSVGQIVEVTILEKDEEKQKISLTMKENEKEDKEKGKK